MKSIYLVAHCRDDGSLVITSYVWSVWKYRSSVYKTSARKRGFLVHFQLSLVNGRCYCSVMCFPRHRGKYAAELLLDSYSRWNAAVSASWAAACVVTISFSEGVRPSTSSFNYSWRLLTFTVKPSKLRRVASFPDHAGLKLVGRARIELLLGKPTMSSKHLVPLTLTSSSSEKVIHLLDR